MDKPTRRQAIKASIVAALGLMAATVTPTDALTARIRRSLARRADLGFKSGLIVLSYEGFDQVRAACNHAPNMGAHVDGVLCMRLPELTGDEYWITPSIFTGPATRYLGTVRG